MIKRLLAYFLFILGLFTVSFFRVYAGQIIPYPYLFWFAGLTMWLIGYFIIKNTPTAKEQAAINRLKEHIDYLKKEGEKIAVDLSKVEIKENNYSEDEEELENFNTALFLLEPGRYYGTKDQRPKLTDVKQSVIIYTNTSTGEKFISQVIPKDRETLMFKFDSQKTTTLYVYKADRKMYYFDLDFLFD